VRPVNLLPPRYRPARATGERPGIGYAAIGVLAVLLLMVVLYVVTNNKINDAKEATARANAEAAVAQAKAGQLTAYGDFSQLKNARQAAVASIAEVRFDWERLMREVALVLPKGVYLTSFSGAGGTSAEGAEAANPTAALAGCAPDHPGVAATVVRLRKLHNALRVDLANSVKAKTTAGAAAVPCKTSWSAAVEFKPETPPTTSTPVPARLGGGQ
jgi:Tfp pilus assembly protein PilN